VPATTITFSTTDLVRFLLARVDDEEIVLRKLARRHRGDESAQTELIDRQRSDIIAKRQVLGHVQQLLVLRDQPNEKTVRDTATQILRSMAMPYAEHASYRDEWRVTTR
jgi:hypothetical protein